MEASPNPIYFELEEYAPDRIDFEQGVHPTHTYRRRIADAIVGVLDGQLADGSEWEYPAFGDLYGPFEEPLYISGIDYFNFMNSVISQDGQTTFEKFYSSYMERLNIKLTDMVLPTPSLLKDMQQVGRVARDSLRIPPLHLVQSDLIAPGTAYAIGRDIRSSVQITNLTINDDVIWSEEDENA